MLLEKLEKWSGAAQVLRREDAVGEAEEMERVVTATSVVVIIF